MNNFISDFTKVLNDNGVTANDLAKGQTPDELGQSLLGQRHTTFVGPNGLPITLSNPVNMQTLSDTANPYIFRSSAMDGKKTKLLYGQIQDLFKKYMTNPDGSANAADQAAYDNLRARWKAINPMASSLNTDIEKKSINYVKSKYAPKSGNWMKDVEQGFGGASKLEILTLLAHLHPALGALGAVPGAINFVNDTLLQNPTVLRTLSQQSSPAANAGMRLLGNLGAMGPQIGYSKLVGK